MKKLAALILCISCGGCATIFRDTTQELSIRTSPPGATVFIDGKKMEGVTPMDIVVPKETDGLEMEFRLEGFITQYFFVKSGESWLTALDWIAILPALFDYLFVNRIKYKPSHIHVPLKPASPSAVSSSP